MSDENWYKLDALSSITAYELAQILQSMEIKCDENVLNKMPKDCRRHFQKCAAEDNEIELSINK